MRELIITNHEVVKDFIMVILGTDKKIPIKSHVGPEDVKEKVVYSDRKIPPYLLKMTRDFFVIKTDKWVDLSRCSLVDLIVAGAKLISAKTGDEAALAETIREIYYMRIDAPVPTASSMSKQVMKARESLKILKI